MAIKNVGVIGCGIMGGGIAQVCVTHGYDVTVLEVDQARLTAGLERIKSGLARELSRGRIAQEQHDGALERLRGTVDISDFADRDMIIEAAIEEINAKRELFGRLGEVCRPDTIIASNTSSLSISELAGVTKLPERVIGMHFFNPPVVLKLVEIVPTAATAPGIADTAAAFCESIDRVVVRTKDTTGFVVNRLFVPFLLDAIRLVESGVATPEDIDQACQTGLGHTMGPIASCDLVGLDTLANICDVMFEEYGEAHFKAPTLLKRMVALNRLGRKTGQGFYTHSK